MNSFMSIEPQHSERPKAERRFVSNRHELRYVCDKVRYWLYTRKNETVATRYQDRLQRLLKTIPSRDIAIQVAEARVLLCILKAQMRREIKLRQREIELIVRLQLSLKGSVKSGKMSRKTASKILNDTGYNLAGLRRRRAIV